MVAIRGTFNGEVIVPDEPLDLARNQRVLVHIEPIQPQRQALTASALLRSPLTGLWQDRTAIEDSSTFARKLREQAQQRSSPPATP